MGQDGLIFDDVSWWSGFKKGGDVIYDVDIGLRSIAKVMRPKNQVNPSHGAPIVSSAIVLDGGIIPSFSESTPSISLHSVSLSTPSISRIFF